MNVKLKNELLVKSMNVGWWVQRWSELHPNKNAIFYKEKQISYFELQQRANLTSYWLKSLGIKKGDRVAIMLNNCPEFIELYLSCAKLGVIFVPINTRLRIGELKYLLENSSPKLLVFHSTFFKIINSPDLNHCWSQTLLSCVDGYSFPLEVLDYVPSKLAFTGETPCFVESSGPTKPEDPQVIMYTSGTTGKPKGAVLPYRKTFFNCLNTEIYFDLHFDDVMLIVLPLFHSGGLFMQASPTIYKGATMIIHPHFDPSKVYQDIEQLKVTKFLGVPTVYRKLLKVNLEERKNISSLKVCSIGGEKTPHDLLIRCRESRFNTRQIMGQTETSSFLWASEGDSLRKPGTVGKPVFHAEVRIFDKEGRDAQPGEVGEIVVRGPIVMTNYWQDPVKTKEAIKNGWLHTGDLARMDDEGYFYPIDRLKDMYISGGENVYTAEVEQVLREHPAIEDVAVVGISDDTWGETGLAFIIPKSGAEISAEAIFSFCEGKLAHFKLPKKINFCQDFPRTSLGKVQKSKLIRSLEKRMNSTTNPKIQ